MSNYFLKVIILTLCLLALVLCTSAQKTKKKQGNRKPPAIPINSNRPGLGINEQDKLVALDVLRKANLAHGGTALDNLKTLRIKGKRRVNDHFFDLDIIIDITSQKVREETRGVNGFLNIRQIDAQGGWSFFDKLVTKLDAEEQDELENVLIGGLFGLRSDSLNQTSITYFADDKPNEQKLIRVLIKGKEYTWIFDTKNRLITQSSKNQTRKETTLFDDFRSVSEINMPHRSVLGSLIVEYSNSVLTVDDWTNIEVNPKFAEKDWAIPESKKYFYDR
jgi:hypothetical protein